MHLTIVNGQQVGVGNIPSGLGFGGVGEDDSGGGLSGVFTGGNPVLATDKARALAIAGGGASYDVDRWWNGMTNAWGAEGGNGNSGTSGGRNTTMEGSNDRVMDWWRPGNNNLVDANGISCQSGNPLCGSSGGGGYEGGDRMPTNNSFYQGPDPQGVPQSCGFEVAAARGGSGYVDASKAVFGTDVIESTSDGPSGLPPNTNDPDYVVGVGVKGTDRDPIFEGGHGLAVICWIPPTEEPTSAPTAAGTADPTAEPTSTPTAIPTADPTTEPTSTPTAAPTVEPTTEPTSIPTLTPTAEPTAEPTSEPTSTPTATPPTAEPTSQPTSVPSVTPTTAPTTFSTVEPTLIPTAFPTAEPTPEPVVVESARTNHPEFNYLWWLLLLLPSCCLLLLLLSPRRREGKSQSETRRFEMRSLVRDEQLDADSLLSDVEDNTPTSAEDRTHGTSIEEKEDEEESMPRSGSDKTDKSDSDSTDTLVSSSSTGSSSSSDEDLWDL